MHIDSTLFETINNIISAAVTIFSLLVLTAYFFYTAFNNHKKHGAGRGIYLSFLTLVLLSFPLVGIILLPEYLVHLAKQREIALLSYMPLSAFRWFVLYAVLCPLAFIVTQKFSGIKSTFTTCAHLSVFLLGWLMGKWFGILFISLPIFGIFYFLLYHYAQITFPASVPEDEEEIRNKFLALFWYVWGAQYSFWGVQERATRKIEKYVDGDFFKEYGKPGIVWTHPYQVLGQSAGVEFNKIDGPGILFTGQYERPTAVVDLRTQLRTTDFPAVTKDGVNLRGFLFTSFKIDAEDWSLLDGRERHRLYRSSQVLRKGRNIDNNNGSYPYSSARVQAALSASRIDASLKKEESDDDELYWDEIVVDHVKKQAQLVLSERRFDEIWVPINQDERHDSSIDEMANLLKGKAAPILQEMGVQLLGSRIVNFIFDEDNPIKEELLDIWMSRWTQKIEEIHLEGSTKAEELRLQAHTSARTVFLESITESLNKAREINKELPKQVVALNFISTLKKLIKTSEISEENAEQQTIRLDILRELLLQSN